MRNITEIQNALDAVRALENGRQTKAAQEKMFTAALDIGALLGLTSERWRNINVGGNSKLVGSWHGARRVNVVVDSVRGSAGTAFAVYIELGKRIRLTSLTAEQLLKRVDITPVVETIPEVSIPADVSGDLAILNVIQSAIAQLTPDTRKLLDVDKVLAATHTKLAGQQSASDAFTRTLLE